MALTTTEAFSLAATLHAMDPRSALPRDLPGRYGRATRDLERLTAAADALSVVAGGWAVWHHGYAGRVTEDVDIVVAQSKLGRLQELAGAFGFEYLQPPPGRWPKLRHKETGIDVDVLPEFGIPGTPSHPAPVAIRNPELYQAIAGVLRYITLEGLVELKLGAGRAKDIADIIELIRHNPDSLQAVHNHLSSIHPSYYTRFQQLVIQAEEEQ